MAESNKNEETESWWSSWFQSAKEKSSATLEFMKRDLTEFTQTVQTDAAAAVYNSASLLKEKLKVDSSDSVVNKARQGLNTVLSTLTEVFSPSRELDSHELRIIHNSEPVMLDRWEAQLYAVRIDENTYCHEPEGPPELYESWLEVFNLDDHEEEISEIMANYREVRKLYAQLVPAAVSNGEFWQRYFYKVHQLRENEARIAELMRRTDVKSPGNDFEWDEDDEEDSPSRRPGGPHNQVQSSSDEQNIQNKSSHLSSFSCATGKKDISERQAKNSTLNEKSIDEELRNISHLSSQVAGDDKHQLSSEMAANNSDSQLNIQHSQKDVCVSSQNIPSEMPAPMSCDGVSHPYKEKLKELSSTKLYHTDASPASSISGGKDGSTEDEWEKDFDLDGSDKDLKSFEVNKGTKEITTTVVEEGWENWE